MKRFIFAILAALAFSGCGSLPNSLPKINTPDTANTPARQEVVKKVQSRVKNMKAVSCPKPNVDGVGGFTIRCRGTLRGKKASVKVKWGPLSGYTIGKPVVNKKP